MVMKPAHRVRNIHGHLLPRPLPSAAAGTSAVFAPGTVDLRLSEAEASGVLNLRLLSESLGAEVKGVDLSKPLSASQIDAIYGALLRHKVLVFKEQHIDHEAHVRFTKEVSSASPSLGPPTIGHTIFGYAEDALPEIWSVYQGPKKFSQGMPPVNPQPWSGFHCDITACVNPPAIGMLRATIMPPTGGDTKFANFVQAYEDLDDSMKKAVENLWGRHSYGGGDGKGEFDQVINGRKMVSEHPMCVVHPDTKERVLFCSPGFLTQVVGMETRKSNDLLRQLWLHATQPKYVVSHKWDVGDVVIWDERSTAHCAPTDVVNTGYERQLYRTTLVGQRPRSINGVESVLVEGEPMVSAEEELAKGHDGRRPFQPGNTWGAKGIKNASVPLAPGQALTREDSAVPQKFLKNDEFEVR